MRVTIFDVFPARLKYISPRHFFDDPEFDTPLCEEVEESHEGQKRGGRAIEMVVIKLRPSVL